jgi:hypothetical protein
MKHWLWLALVGLFIGSPWGTSSPTQARKPSALVLPPHGVQYQLVTCNGGERTLVIASGRATSAVGLYVYDPHGNCIARDEALSPRAGDDLAAEWFPPVTSVYTVELRNQGIEANALQLAFR